MKRADFNFEICPFSGALDRNRTYDNPASEAGALSTELQAHVLIIAERRSNCNRIFCLIGSQAQIDKTQHYDI